MSKIADKIRDVGLFRVAAELEDLARNAIQLVVTPDLPTTIGTSRLGGLPDLPDEIDWPTWNGVPLAFIAQINVAEGEPFDLEECLPKSGMLYFFYEAARQTWGYDPKDSGSCRVLFYEGPVSDLTRRKAPGDLPSECAFPMQAVLLEPEMLLPSWPSIDIERLALSDDEQERYFDLIDALRPQAPLHWLLGHPDQIQNEMQLECQLASNGIYCGDATGHHDPRRAVLEKTATDWRLLLQVDSDEHMTWGDVGHIYFWIRKQDLEERDFSNCWLILQCT